jgi:hypothetical protein
MGASGELRGFWHEPAGTPTSKAIALKEWAVAAHEILSGVAGTYQAVIRHGELAEQVQARSQIHTSQDQRNWIKAVLSPVVHMCHRADEPPLTSLVVRKHDGSVGESYDEVLAVAGHPPVTDPLERERHAARSRLECYRWAGSAPPDGGEAVLAVPATRAKVVRERRPAKVDLPVRTCPTCFMALPSTGVCDSCG